MSWRTLALNKLVLDRAVKMLLLTTIVVVALSVSLWRQALHSKRSFGLALAAALLCALGLLALLAIAGRMPRGATPLDQKELVYGVLAASDDYALVKISKGLARVSLPQGRIERRYPVDPLGVVNQVAAHGDVVALVATVAAQDGGFERRLTLLSKEGFILEPGARRFPGTSHVGVSWSRQEERFFAHRAEASNALGADGRALGCAGPVDRSPIARAPQVPERDGGELLGWGRSASAGSRGSNLQVGERRLRAHAAFQGPCVPRGHPGLSSDP